MSFLIAADVKNNLVLHHEILKLVDSFSVLSEKEMLFLILYCDYNSIYKQFPDHERKRRAMFHAFDDNQIKLIESQRIQDAIKDYISLQYNPKIELIKKYQQKIDSFTNSMEEDNSPTSIKKTIDAIDSIRKSIHALEKEVDDQTLNDGVIKGNMSLSFLERIMANRKLYLSITAKK